MPPIDVERVNLEDGPMRFLLMGGLGPHRLRRERRCRPDRPGWPQWHLDERHDRGWGGRSWWGEQLKPNLVDDDGRTVLVHHLKVIN